MEISIKDISKINSQELSIGEAFTILFHDQGTIKSPFYVDNTSLLAQWRETLGKGERNIVQPRR